MVRAKPTIHTLRGGAVSIRQADKIVRAGREVHLHRASAAQNSLRCEGARRICGLDRSCVHMEQRCDEILAA